VYYLFCYFPCKTYIHIHACIHAYLQTYKHRRQYIHHFNSGEITPNYFSVNTLSLHSETYLNGQIDNPPVWYRIVWYRMISFRIVSYNSMSVFCAYFVYGVCVLVSLCTCVCMYFRCIDVTYVFLCTYRHTYIRAYCWQLGSHDNDGLKDIKSWLSMGICYWQRGYAQ